MKNQYMHIDYAERNDFQSATPKVPKCQFDTLDCTLEGLAALELIQKDPYIKQKDMVRKNGKSFSSVKRIMDVLQQKQIIRRANGKR